MTENIFAGAVQGVVHQPTQSRLVAILLLEAANAAQHRPVFADTTALDDAPLIQEAARRR